MKRIYYTTQRRLGYRSFSQIEGPDVVELKRMLHALGYWRPALTAFPAPPAVPNTREMQELRRTNPAQSDKLQAAGRRLPPTSLATTRSTTPRRSQRSTSSVPTEARLRGNPPGLVDERLVTAPPRRLPGEAPGRQQVVSPM